MEAAEQANRTPLTFHALTPDGNERFHDAITAAKATLKFGASVHAYEPGEYRDTKMFVTPDNKTGFVVKSDGDIASAFSRAKADRAGDSILALAVQQGGNKLDAFDTVLPKLYGDNGFRAVARLAWSDQYAPEGWDKATFAKFNHGEPDVVFMVHDPAHAQAYKPGDGVRVTTYDEGVAAQAAALAAIKGSRKSFRQMTLSEASVVLPPVLFRKYYMRVQEFFDANAHLARDISSIVIVVRENELETRARKKTVVELWPETDEPRAEFMDRCIGALTKCIGPKKAPGVCAVKWRKSEKLGKKDPEKAFVARGLDDTEATEACGGTCVGCEGADAPFDKAFDPNEPRDEAGKWTDAGGSDDELGSLALGGEDRFKTPSTRKVDALRDEMGIVEADVPFEQRQALDIYTQDSTSFNQSARRGGPGAVPAEMQNLDKLVGSYKLPHDMTVYRTVGWLRTKNIVDHVGDVFSEPGFMSTTLDKSKIDKPGSYIEIQIPKDSQAFPVGSLSNYPEEAEILFPRNSRLQIVSHEPRDAPNTERFVARLVSS